MGDTKKEIKKLNFKNVDEVLEFAVTSEENAKNFYSSWAQKVEKRSLKIVFEELAAEEAKHKDFLLGIKKDAGLKPSEDEILNLGITDYVMDVKATADMNYQEALIVSMHREKNAYKLYSGMAEMTSDAKMKATFKMLAQQEAIHKLRLESIYDDEILQEN
ncbi:MAG: ferritin family protein [bacterium]|nr:ferritin family protein [bacterium]